MFLFCEKGKYVHVFESCFECHLCLVRLLYRVTFDFAEQAPHLVYLTSWVWHSVSVSVSLSNTPSEVSLVDSSLTLPGLLQRRSSQLHRLIYPATDSNCFYFETFLIFLILMDIDKEVYCVICFTVSYEITLNCFFFSWTGKVCFTRWKSKYVEEMNRQSLCRDVWIKERFCL